MEEATKHVRFSWQWPAYVASAAVIVFLAMAIGGEADAELLYVLLIAPAAFLILLIGSIIAICKKRVRFLSALIMLLVYCAFTFGLLVNYSNVRNAGRWLLWSRSYKAEVLAQAESPNGEFRHIEWDGWGFPSAGNTVVYLVFDPANSLATEAELHSSVKLNGIPCEVPQVRRLESNWYAVTFYTGDTWGHCS